MNGLIIYRASHFKPGDRPWATNDELQSEHYAEHVQPPSVYPLQFALPSFLPQTILASPYDRPDPLLAEQAAYRLFSHRQKDFAAAADAVARHHLNLPFDSTGKPEQYTHVHGIGSWEDKLEPSMATIFHRPVSPLQLQKIAADVGSLANQEGILAFVPHPGGVEQMVHLRFPSHNPLIKRLNPGLVADISKKVTEQFNQFHTVSPQGVRESLIPGRSILPDTEGHTDVLVWVPSFVTAQQQGMMHDAMQHIAHNLGGGLQYWTGTGKIVGGLHPYDNDPNSMSDARKRAIAQDNYARTRMLEGPSTAAYPGDVELPKYETTEAEKLMRAPAGSGIVVRGVFYRPGMVIPDLITPDKEKVKMSLDDFKKKLRVAYGKGRNN